MASLKTARNDASVEDFINGVEDETKRDDCRLLLELMENETGCKPEMWGTSIVGFGSYHYKYKSGREGDWFRIGFAPRKQSMTVYVMDGFEKRTDLLADLGKHKIGKSCLYFKKLDDVDVTVLKELFRASLKHFEKKYGPNDS